MTLNKITLGEEVNVNQSNHEQGSRLGGRRYIVYGWTRVSLFRYKHLAGKGPFDTFVKRLLNRLYS